MNRTNNIEKLHKFKLLEDNFEITENTLVVIDTNYLLYTLQSYYFGEKYIDALNKNIENLYIPYIVFMEFYNQKDRLVDHIKVQFQSLPGATGFSDHEELIDINDLSNNTLNNKTFKDFQLYQSRDDQIKYETDELIKNYREELKSEIKNSIDTINNKFTKLKNKYKNHIEETYIDSKKYTERANKLSDSLKDIINYEGVLGRMYDKDEFNNEKFSDILKWRYDNKIGPGYEDGLTEEKQQFGTILYPKGSGDYILWMDTIEYVKKYSDEYTNVMIVTSDNKEDWYQKSHEKINPHLKVEFYMETGKNVEIMKTEDYILTFAQFTEEEKQKFTKDYASIKRDEKEGEGSEYRTVFEILGQEFKVHSQNEMMVQIINKLNYEYQIHSHHLNKISCFLKVNEMIDNKDYIHTADNKLFEINKTYNIYQKLIFIKQLFDNLDIEYEELEFTSGFIKQYESSFQEIWEQTTEI